VGSMGQPASQTVSAIGETVSMCARLETLTKDYDCVVTISRRAAEMANLTLRGRQMHQAEIAGLSQPVEFYALRTLRDLQP
jgi:class 3 adenylate cyclase